MAAANVVDVPVKHGRDDTIVRGSAVIKARVEGGETVQQEMTAHDED